MFHGDRGHTWVCLGVGGRGCMRVLEGEGDRGWKVVFEFDN